MKLARLDDQRMEFVEECGIVRQSGFESRAELFVGRLGISKAVAFKNAAGVGVDYEDRTPAGVKKDGIGRFGADAAEVE